MTDERDRFLKLNREHMETAFVAASADSVDRPLVVGLDLRNPTARQIAAARTSESEVENRIKQCEADGSSPCLFFSVNHDDAVACFASLTPSGGKFLATSIPDGAYRFLIITTSGARWGVSELPT